MPLALARPASPQSLDQRTTAEDERPAGPGGVDRPADRCRDHARSDGDSLSESSLDSLEAHPSPARRGRSPAGPDPGPELGRPGHS